MDTLTITRQLVDAGFDRAQAEAVADVLRGPNSDLATRASLYRALWLQTGAMVAAVAGILAIVSRLP